METKALIRSIEANQRLRTGVAIKTAQELAANAVTSADIGVTVQAHSDDLDDLENAWATYTPTISPNAGTFTSVSATGRYRQLGKLVHFSIDVLITTNGTASGFWTATLPVASVNSGHNQSASGTEQAVTGFAATGWILNNSTTLLVTKYDGNYLGANSYRVIMQGTYEAA